ncbi:MAG: hypothetical protein CMQ61_14770 [Gammaproteobacteria bacterium]|nr:hypothetical protein [Gammaproteobacteria bacterium]
MPLAYCTLSSVRLMSAPVTLEELFAGYGANLDAMYQRVKGLMEAEGVWTLSSCVAQIWRNASGTR